MPFELVIAQMKAEALHLFGKWLFQLWSILVRKDVGIIDPPTTHGLASNLCWEIPDVTRNVIRNREEIKVRDLVIASNRSNLPLIWSCFTCPAVGRHFAQHLSLSGSCRGA